MNALVDEDGRTYLCSADLPAPHWSDCSFDGTDYLASLKAIYLYPKMAPWIILASNIAAKEANDERGSCAVTNGRGALGEESA
jgi:hypothetical protein